MRIAAALDVSPSDMILGDNKDIDIIPAEGVEMFGIQAPVDWSSAFYPQTAC